MDLTDISSVFVAYFIRANLRGASLGTRMGGVHHGPIAVLVMARVRQNGESSLVHPVISNDRSMLYPAQSFSEGRSPKSARMTQTTKIKDRNVRSIL